MQSRLGSLYQAARNTVRSRETDGAPRIEDFLTEQAAVTEAVAKSATPGAGASPASAADAIRAWAGTRTAAIDGARRTSDEIEQSGSGWTFAKLTIINSALRDLATAR